MRRLTWGTPVAIPNTAGMISPDKNWIVCDNIAASPFYGNCYTEWDDNGAGNRMEMSRSTDGGPTWSVATTNNNGIIGGQPVVRARRHGDRADPPTPVSITSSLAWPSIRPRRAPRRSWA